MARRRSLASQLEREVRRYVRRSRAGAGGVRRAADDAEVVRTRFAVDPDWRRVHAGRAARLGPRETIDLRGVGRFADRDPRTVVVGWRSVGRVLGAAGWAGVVAAGWWLGRRGRGPMRDLEHDPR